MKVALIAHSRYPVAAPFAGGLESFTWHLVRGLRARGAETVLFAGPGSDPALGAETLQVSPVELTEAARADVAMPPGTQVEETVAYLEVMRQLTDRPDVDVVHNNSLHYVPIAMARSIPRPVLTTLHTPPQPWIESALRLTPGVATAAVSQAVADQWRAVTDATVIHNGVDLDVWTPGPGGPGLVWFGRLVPEKAPHVAAQIARAAGLPLRIAGPVSDPAYVREHLAPLLGDGVEHVGHLGPDDLRTLVGSSAACLVTPEWDEPFGLVAAEAMACGTPVLALRRGGLPEVVRGDGGVTIEPDAPAQDTVEPLRAVLGMDRRGVRRHAEQHCDLRTTVERYLACYEELR